MHGHEVRLAPAAYITALNCRIVVVDADMACVQFHNHMYIKMKRTLADAREPHLRGLEVVYGCDREEAISKQMAVLNARQKTRHSDWRNRWVPHPKTR